MFFAFLLTLIAIGVGYYIHQQYSPAPATPEVSIPGGSKRENVAASKRDIPSVDNTAANEATLQSAIGGTQTLETGDKFAVEQLQRDESSRDVKTARSPTQAEILSFAAVAAAAPTDANNNTVQLVNQLLAILHLFLLHRISTELSKYTVLVFRVKPDPETNSSLSEKKKVKKRSSGAKKFFKKSKEIKSADGGASV